MTTLRPDPHNANRGTKRGRELLMRSLQNLGAGRSILVDRNGYIIAGNKTYEAAQALGIKVRVVETDGDELIAVRRRDLDLEEGGKARELAYADNRVAEIDLEWDAEQLAADNDRHPTMKPIELPQNAIANHTEAGDLVVDIFLGSGTTMVAAQNLGRRCYGIEIEPKYVAVTLERMAEAFPGIEIRRIE